MSKTSDTVRSSCCLFSGFLCATAKQSACDGNVAALDELQVGTECIGESDQRLLGWIARSMLDAADLGLVDAGGLYVVERRPELLHELRMNETSAAPIFDMRRLVS